MPTKKQLQDVFNALTKNGIDFIRRSARELESEPKFSAAHFAIGLELLLKARLFSEHWTLISTTPHGCSWSAMESGAIHTIQASGLCAAVTTTTGTSLAHEKSVFEKVFAHRNRVLHWIPKEDTAEIAAEQCRAWYKLHRLLTRTWAEQFSEFAMSFEHLDNELLVYRTYLQTRYEELMPSLNGPKAEGLLVECPACKFMSGVLSDKIATISALRCEVCRGSSHIAKFKCGYRVPLFELPCKCQCGEEHDREELAELLDPTPILSPKEKSSHESARAHCGDCLDHDTTVVPISNGYVCTACGAEFEPQDVGNCEWCNALWAGYDLEGSAVMGCEFCDGHYTDD